jgi:1,4-dihydroxy-6-naphthoate synthase
MLRESIRYALAHRELALDELCAERRELTRGQADEYLSLYANADTVDYGDDGRRAIDVLLADAAEQGLVPRARIEYAP